MSETHVPETSVGESLHRLLHAYKRAMRQAYQEVNLTLAVSHIRSLKVINHAREKNTICTAQVIAERLQRDKAQITRVVKDLLEEGLIEKRDNPEDRRSQLLLLTQKGVDAYKTIKEVEALAGTRMAQGLNADEIREFVKLANAMAENLKH
ncbi:MarR family transcriptional regulator [Hahella sp. KA22]|uniref:MarR family winged helix-turn-helix transcriptional regulator n=1 Tax=Hahella sp. KA22 TaxID=1628392 RepID=UPI000FDF5ABA|nr:MarR family transcriptional regulator [Hahella sp. KA22]AZZ92445.1 MarR family transcriptional regulator [Hahella sp. KA22]QAY55819.1 MarR family transcriptional regulator [Hahella sp. KA22]